MKVNKYWMYNFVSYLSCNISALSNKLQFQFQTSILHFPQLEAPQNCGLGCCHILDTRTNVAQCRPNIIFVHVVKILPKAPTIL